MLKNGAKGTVAGVALVVAAMVGGCAGGPRAGGVEAVRSAVVEVRNHNWNMAKVHLAMNGTRVRLGSVASQGTERFRIPSIYIDRSDVRLVVTLLASNQRTATEEFLITPGDHVELTVRNQLSLTSYAVHSY